MKLALVLALALALNSYRGDTEPPAAIAMTDEALGHYCQMYLADHPGPKAQVFIDGYDQPFWFSQVADAAAFRADPEKPARIAAIYVSDMGRAQSWAEPGLTNWIEAGAASYVIDSRQAGGMGLPEAIPFGDPAAAAAFAATNGGRVVAWADVPDDYGRAIDGPITAPGGHGTHGEDAR